MTQQAFWRKHNQRFPEIAMHLPAENVKEIRRCCTIHHLHVVASAHIQETFKSRTGMLSALAFITMRQQHHKSVHALPFIFPGTDILIDYDLCTVHEVAELSFPQDK